MVATRLRFTGSGSGTLYIDLNKALSVQLRKLHRQKVVTTVYGGYFVDAPSGSNTSRIDLNVAPMTWPVKRSINRGFARWRKMIAKTFDNMDAHQSSRKYSDFKIYLDNQMGNSPLMPKDAEGNQIQASAGEWDYSTLISADPEPGAQPGDPDGWELMIVGQHTGSHPNWTRIGLVESWFNSRDPPDVVEPRDVADPSDPLANLFDTGDVDDERMTIINTENDATPYDEDTAFGNAMANGNSNNLMRVSTAITSASQNVGNIHGFEALCGLIQVDVVRAQGDWELVLDVESNGVKF